MLLNNSNKIEFLDEGRTFAPWTSAPSPRMFALRRFDLVFTLNCINGEVHIVQFRTLLCSHMSFCSSVQQSTGRLQTAWRCCQSTKWQSACVFFEPTSRCSRTEAARRVFQRNELYIRSDASCPAACRWAGGPTDAHHPCFRLRCGTSIEDGQRANNVCDGWNNEFVRHPHPSVCMDAHWRVQHEASVRNDLYCVGCGVKLYSLTRASVATDLMKSAAKANHAARKRLKAHDGATREPSASHVSGAPGRKPVSGRCHNMCCVRINVAYVQLVEWIFWTVAVD